MPFKLKNIILLTFSIIFYAVGEPKYIGLLLASILLNYIFCRFIEKSKIFFIMALLTSLIPLFYYKYFDFFIMNIEGIVLPVGISFYTFQMLSYIIDVYKKEVKVQKNFFDLATYILFFPQLVAGPIIRYTDIERSLKYRIHSLDKFKVGLSRFFIGLSKKVILANSLGEICLAFNVMQDKTILIYWIYAVAFSLQIYFDFSGYSDMTIGLAKLFGFEFNENFNYPYISKSVSEFWRRWHISLGTWFRDYIYIPMGGNRVSKKRYIYDISYNNRIYYI
jgi:alginate O-acetyltransferase complex protein AlgI